MDELIRKEFSDWTAIVVAHRLKTVVEFDKDPRPPRRVTQWSMTRQEIFCRGIACSRNYGICRSLNQR